ncbi:MAG: PAS domain S-box protein [Chloroflexi bacterium]|nr:PAS domain S-box protein [Chloroflexota bacterium]
MRESQQRYSTVFDKSPFALALTRMPEGAIVGVNDAFLSLFECKRDEVLGKTSVELGVADPDSRAQVAAELQACGSVQGFEVLRTTKANTRLVLSLDLDWVSIGGENHILTTIHDITKRKQAESALRESEEKYRTLFNSMTEGFALHEIICDEAGAPCDYRFLEINPSFERLTGLHREAVIGKTVKEILPGVEAFWIETYGRVALSGEPAHFDRHSVILDRHYEVYAYCPTPGQFAVLFMDITERKRAEQELIEAQRRLGRERDILQTVMNGAKRSHLVYLDCGFNFVRVNQAYADTCGYQPEEMIGRNHFALYPQEENEAIFARVRDTGEPVEFHDKPFEFPDQPERGVTYWDWTLAPVKDEAGEVEGLVFSLFETTERKQMEQALRKAHDELELRVQERTKELADANRVLSNEITEHKRTEQALELERAKLRNIMDTMPDGIYIVNRQHDIEYVNPVIEREFGLVEGRKCYSYFHERAEACPWCKNEEVFSGKSIRWEWHSHKTQKTYDLFDTPMLNSDGGISKLELFHDITDRKQAEAELEQRNLELQVLSENEHKQRQLAETLRASAQALAQTLDLDIVLRTLLKHVRALVQSDTASVILLEGESLLSVRAVEGYERWTDPNQILSFKVDGANNPFYQKLIATRKSLLIPDTASEPGWEVFPGTEPIRNCIFAPILIEGKIIGVVGLSKAEPNYFTAEHAQWAEALVGQAAVAIQNAWLFEQVRAGRERLQSLSRRLVDIQESERRFVARELHDHAAQNLTSLILGLGAIEKEASQLPKIRARASELKTMTDGVLEDLHRLAINLRPASLDHPGLVPALEQLIKSFTQNSSLQIRFKAAGIGEDDRLPQEVETTLYRITQEALTNVVRHASAQRADVVLERRGDTALVLIEDDGKGFDLEKAKIGGHLGLLGMEERAEMLGGKLTVESVPGKGTIIVAEVPYADPNPARR